MYEILNQDGVTCGDPIDNLSYAAQEAEFLHAAHTQKFVVRDQETREVFYESKGGPD